MITLNRNQNIVKLGAQTLKKGGPAVAHVFSPAVCHFHPQSTFVFFSIYVIGLFAIYMCDILLLPDKSPRILRFFLIFEYQLFKLNFGTWFMVFHNFCYYS